MTIAADKGYLLIFATSSLPFSFTHFTLFYERIAFFLASRFFICCKLNKFDRRNSTAATPTRV
jgi:hypothetical protein